MTISHKSLTDLNSNTDDYGQVNTVDLTDAVGFVAGASAGPATVGASAPTQVLYLQETGDTTAISVDDLHQGQMGDCFLISSIGELVLNHPIAISNMIKVNSNGTETVTLYEGANGKLPNFSTSSFKPVSIDVTNVFPTYAVNNGATQDVLGNLKEIWPQVIEKAFATLNGGYNDIADGGSPVLAMEELTGHAASAMSPSSLTLASLDSLIAANDLIVMDTSAKSGLPYGLVSSHAYMFDGVSGSGSSAMVKLLNPWGFDQPASIPLAQLSKGIAEVDIGHFS